MAAMAALHDPPFRQHHEALAVRQHWKQLTLVGIYPASHIAIGRMPNHLHVNLVLLLEVHGAGAGVTTVDIQLLQARILVDRFADHLVGPVPVLNVGRHHAYHQEKPQGVDHQGALAGPLTFLPAS